MYDALRQTLYVDTDLTPRVISISVRIMKSDGTTVFSYPPSNTRIRVSWVCNQVVPPTFPSVQVYPYNNTWYTDWR